MGQRISLVIARQPVNINNEIVHFNDGNYVIIPVKEKFEKSVPKFFEKISITGVSDLASYTGESGFVDFLISINIQTFMFYHVWEHAEMPFQLYQFAVIDGIVDKDTIHDMDSDYPVLNLKDAGELLGIDFSHFNLENYWSYKDCVKKYNLLQ